MLLDHHQRVVALVCVLSTACAAGADRSRPTAAPRQLETLIAATMQERQIPGAAVAVLKDGRPLLLKGFGVASQETRTPVSVDTIFQIASTTKPFTAMAVMMLVEEGKLELDAPVRRYLEWVPEVYAGVTLRQLLHHTSGVARDLRRENVDEFDVAEFRRRLASATPSFSPGARWEYSNTGYALLSFVVEEVSGRPFGEFLRARIFAPLGMRSTGYRVAQKNDSLHAVGYDLANGEPQRAPHVFSGFGNSGIETSLRDLVRWAKAVEQRKLLRPQTYDLLFGPGKLASGETAKFDFGGASSTYGLGWFLSSYEGETLVTHGGAIAGFSSIVNVFPRQGWTIIVLSNGKQGSDRRGQADAIARAIANRVGIRNKAGAVPSAGQ
ncbi:MAG TPA: serine hydrolase domain-containing protein [Thermoanaerobaculia bacterium]|jgi:CubicO group peptidase (beta-lactamase class C family)